MPILNEQSLMFTCLNIGFIQSKGWKNPEDTFQISEVPVHIYIAIMFHLLENVLLDSQVGWKNWLTGQLI